MTTTLGDRLALARGRPTGFDYLRITLAMAVVVWHSFGLAYGLDWANKAANYLPIRVPLIFIIPAFFALSGFLVTGSLERSQTLFVFAGLRVIRLVPALGVEIVLSALLLGPLFTELSLVDYFADQRFWMYFGNIVGLIHYDLPGVFDHNPVASAVNGQLWTIKWELRCYIALVLLALLGLVRHGLALVVACLAGIIGVVVYQFATNYTGIDPHNDVATPGPALVLGFLLGVAAFRFRESIPWRPDLFVLSLVTYIIIVVYVPHGAVFAVIPVTYSTVFIGLSNGAPTFIVKTGDYSYGLYIYHFAIQQAIVAALPSARHWWVLLPATVILAGCFACFSWFFVEKPALRSKYILTVIDGKLTRLFGQWLLRLTRQVPRV